MRYNNQALLRDGRLAQLVELPLDVRKVTGSSPVPSTIKDASATADASFCFFCIYKTASWCHNGFNKIFEAGDIL